MAADQAERRLYGDQEGRARGTQDPSRSLGPDADGDEVGGDRDAGAGARATGGDRRPAVERAGMGVEPGIVRIVAVADLAEIGAGHPGEELEPQLRVEAGRHAERDEVRELGQRALAED